MNVLSLHKDPTMPNIRYVIGISLPLLSQYSSDLHNCNPHHLLRLSRPWSSNTYPPVQNSNSWLVPACQKCTAFSSIPALTIQTPVDTDLLVGKLIQISTCFFGPTKIWVGTLFNSDVCGRVFWRQRYCQHVMWCNKHSEVLASETSLHVQPGCLNVGLLCYVMGTGTAHTP